MYVDKIKISIGEKMNLKKAVAERLSQILRERSLTQYALYKISGVPQSTISTILNGDIKTIKLSTLHDICVGLGINLSDFFAIDLLKNHNLKNQHEAD